MPMALENEDTRSLQNQDTRGCACHRGVRATSETMSDIETLRRILASHRVIAVVGLSAEWNRPSFFAAKYMQEHGYRIIPVNPRYPSILGETCYPSLRHLPAELAASVGIVDCFRRTADILPIAQDAVAIGAKVLWQQIGVMNLQADEFVRQRGLESVMDRCVKIEHARLFGGLHWAGVNTGIISARRPQFHP
jgi:predicted CoA-binding protein